MVARSHPCPEGRGFTLGSDKTVDFKQKIKFGKDAIKEPILIDGNKAISLFWPHDNELTQDARAMALMVFLNSVSNLVLSKKITTHDFESIIPEVIENVLENQSFCYILEVEKFIKTTQLKKKLSQNLQPKKSQKITKKI